MRGVIRGIIRSHESQRYVIPDLSRSFPYIQFCQHAVRTQCQGDGITSLINLRVLCTNEILQPVHGRAALTFTGAKRGAIHLAVHQFTWSYVVHNVVPSPQFTVLFHHLGW